MAKQKGVTGRNDGVSADGGGVGGSSDKGWPMPVRDRGKSPNSGVLARTGKAPDKSSPTGCAPLTGPLAARIPPERPAQGEGHA